MGIRILETSVTYNTIQAAIDAALNGVGLTSNLTI